MPRPEATSPAPPGPAPGARRAGLEAAALAGLVLALVLRERAGPGLERFALALALLLLVPGLRRLARALGRAPAAPSFAAPALVLGAAALALASPPPGPLPLLLAALALLIEALPPRGSDDATAGPRASLAEEALPLGLAALAFVLPSTRALALALALEAWGPRAPRGSSLAWRRAGGFALLAARGALAGYEWTPLGPVAGDVLAGVALVLALATWRRAGTSRPRGLALLAWACVLGEVASQAASLDTGAARARGPVAGSLPVLLVVGAAFFGVAFALAPRGRPGRVATALATGAALLLAAEGALRAREGPRRREASLDYWYAVQPLAAPLVALAPDGFLDPAARERPDYRGRRFQVEKPPGTFRVVLLGGSSAFGVNQPSREASPSGRIEADLRAALPPGLVPEVVCLASPGFTSDQELGQVAGHGLELGADLVLALDGYNDLVFLAGTDASPGDMNAWPQHRRGLASPVARELMERSRLAERLLAPLVTATLEPFDERMTDAGSNRFYLDGLVANEEAMAVLARESGARFAWASIPIAQDRPLPGPGEDAILRAAGPALAQRTREARRRIRPVVAAQGAVELDLAAALAARSVGAEARTWFTDNCHWTDDGVEVVAAEVVAALAARGALPR